MTLHSPSKSRPWIISRMAKFCTKRAAPRISHYVIDHVRASQTIISLMLFIQLMMLCDLLGHNRSGTGSDQTADIPVSGIALLSTVLLVVLVILNARLRRYVRRLGILRVTDRRGEAICCASCGYDVRGLSPQAVVCPECGTLNSVLPADKSRGHD
jgi:hypothetical protein